MSFIQYKQIWGTIPAQRNLSSHVGTRDRKSANAKTQIWKQSMDPSYHYYVNTGCSSYSSWTSPMSDVNHRHHSLGKINYSEGYAGDGGTTEAKGSGSALSRAPGTPWFLAEDGVGCSRSRETALGLWTGCLTLEQSWEWSWQSGPNVKHKLWILGFTTQRCSPYIILRKYSTVL